jgi:hypothetical protein
MSISRFALLLLAVAALPPLGAQAPRVLDKAQAEIAEPFTNVGSIRELSDGRVVVIDNGDRAVYAVDFKAGTSTQIGRPGDGPNEYRTPTLLLPAAADTTLVVDIANRRLLVLGPDAQPAGLITDAWPFANGGPGTRLPRGVDGRGRGYFLGTATNPANSTNAARSGQITQPDSVPLLRVTRGTTADEVLGYVHLAQRRVTATQQNGKITSMNVQIPPFSSQDGWQPFPDGAVAIVRVSDYRVDWVLPDGGRASGKPLAFSRVRVTDKDKAGVPNGAPAARGVPAGTAVMAGPATLDWPEFKPPFPWTGVLAGSDGRVWVQRYGAAEDTRTHYDVIDRRGVVAARVDVPNGGHIVGFGARAIYVVRKDADDLQYLQRFPL